MTKERELLRRAYNYIGETYGYSHSIALDIRTFLTTEPEAEPVAWLASYPEDPDFGKWFCYTNSAEFLGIKYEPLYLHPPRPESSRKPMTEEEIDEEIATNEHYCERSFAEGIRFAEKHHGISE